MLVFALAAFAATTFFFSRSNKNKIVNFFKSIDKWTVDDVIKHNSEFTKDVGFHPTRCQSTVNFVAEELYKFWGKFKSHHDWTFTQILESLRLDQFFACFIGFHGQRLTGGVFPGHIFILIKKGRDDFVLVQSYLHEYTIKKISMNLEQAEQIVQSCRRISEYQSRDQHFEKLQQDWKSVCDVELQDPGIKEIKHHASCLIWN